MRATAVINCVGLNTALLAHAPNLRARAEAGGLRRLRPVLPAVTCSVQSSMLTGAPVREHGVVGNGWYDRESCEVRFWKQANPIVHGEKVWETARRRDPSATCANLFWWYAMYASTDVTVTPRPMYPADGRKIPDVWTNPPALRRSLQERLGTFPLFRFWGPAASIESTRWIADAARIVHADTSPSLMLVYLPHLDYPLQKLGPGHPSIPSEVAALDAVAGDLIASLEDRGVNVIVVSEYGIEPVEGAVEVNRVLRRAGLITVREELGREILDPGASDAFAVCDHQVAHVYLRDPARADEIANLLRDTPGIETVLGAEERSAAGLDHARAGDLVAVAARGRWLAYPWWLDEDRAPDFARTVDIHRKPGYDPLELFLDPDLAAPRLRIAWALLRKRLGFRTLMRVIPTDTSLVRGSHGRTEQPEDEQPLLIAPSPLPGDAGDPLPCTAVRDVILNAMFGGEGTEARRRGGTKGDRA